ncbi:uncharacterized protein DS421_14g460040 [Arachis hypogaea]|uniref:Uncharacterized protein n=1 Tax=Arachis hypogaea TaxID=3818 RepID=A0A444ZH56_ARAHY|nr:uncharacterized protein DS421_14g460040 [Arachis hypogaea]RYR13547.1 hypothetical protein Ahy_B04g070479 isoform C [Arachis hypogaea]
MESLQQLCSFLDQFGIESRNCTKYNVAQCSFRFMARSQAPVLSGDIFKIAELDDELSSIKQGDLTITAYFTRLKVIWEELENLRPIPQCVACDSNNCLCGLMKIRKYQDNAYVVRFLKGLNEAYSNVRSQVMMMEPVSKINQVLSMILQQKRQLHTLEPIDCKALISASNNFSYPNRGRGRDRAPGKSHGRDRRATK